MRLKSFALMLVATLSQQTAVKAQLYAGAEGITILDNTTFSTDGLVFLPTSALAVTNLSIQKSVTAVVATNGSSINRVYELSNPLNVKGSVGFYYNDTELNGNTAALLVPHYKNRLTDNAYASGGMVNVANRFVSQTFADATFTHFTAANNTTTLAVKLKDFIAKIEGNRTNLNWVTLSEENNERFEIEHSGNGKDFSVLLKVRGKGTTNAAQNYQTYDNHPLNGVNYYRLKQYDFSGQVTDLGVRSVNFKLNAVLRVMAYPNPTTENVNLVFTNYTGAEAKVIITDLLGKTIHTEKLILDEANTSYKLSLAQKLAVGQYFVSVSGTNLQTTIKLIAH